MAKTERPKARDPKKAQDYMDGKAVDRGNAADKRRAKEAAMDKADKKACGGKMKKGCQEGLRRQVSRHGRGQQGRALHALGIKHELR
jgi:hypothetical protein